MLSVQTENKHLLIWVVTVLIFFMIKEVSAQNYPPPEIIQGSRHAINEQTNPKTQLAEILQRKYYHLSLKRDPQLLILLEVCSRKTQPIPRHTIVYVFEVSKQGEL